MSHYGPFSHSIRVAVSGPRKAYYEFHRHELLAHAFFWKVNFLDRSNAAWDNMIVSKIFCRSTVKGVDRNISVYFLKINACSLLMGRI